MTRRGEAFSDWHVHTHTGYYEASGADLFDSVAYDVRLDEEHQRSVDVPQFEVGESGRLQMFPRVTGHLAAVAEVVPGRLQDVLEEVGPGGRVCHHVLQEEEGAALQSRGRGEGEISPFSTKK